MNNLLEHTKGSSIELEDAAENILDEFERKLAAEHGGMSAVLWEELKNEKLSSIEVKRKNRKKTDFGEGIELLEELIEVVDEKKEHEINYVDDLPLTVPDDDIIEAEVTEKDRNEKGIIPRLESDSKEDAIITDLKNYKLEYNDVYININFEQKHYFIFVNDEDGNLIPKRLSNFVILPLYSITDEDGKRKDIVQIVNNKEMKVVTLDAETKSSNNKFKTFVLENGKFNWLGSQKQLDQLIEFILFYETEEIVEISYVGWHESEKAWFFPTHAYVDGLVYYPNEDGIFKTHKKNYLLVKNEAFNICVEHVKDKPIKDEIIQAISNFQTLYDTHGWLGIGFTMSSMHVNEFAKKTKQHPFLYAHGMRNKGKTEYLKSVFRFAGMDPKLPPPPRLDGLRKRLAWFSHLPIGYDEAEEKSIKTLDFFVKNRDTLNTVFNRSSLERGTNDPNKLLFYPVRGTLVFGGEVATSDSAITTRTVFVDALKIIQDEKAFDTLEAHINVMYWLGQFMMRTSVNWKQMLFNNYEMINNHFRSLKDVSSRIRKNFSMLSAGAITFTQCIDEEFGTNFYTRVFLQDLLDNIEYEMLEGQKEAESNHPAINYLKDLAYLAQRNKLYNTDYKIEGDLLYIAPDSTWRVYEEWKKNPHYNSSRKVVNDLEAYKDSFFLGRKTKRIQGKQYKCWIIDITQFPDDGLQGFLVEDRT